MAENLSFEWDGRNLAAHPTERRSFASFALLCDVTLGAVLLLESEAGFSVWGKERGSENEAPHLRVFGSPLLQATSGWRSAIQTETAAFSSGAKRKSCIEVVH